MKNNISGHKGDLTLFKTADAFEWPIREIWTLSEISKTQKMLEISCCGSEKRAIVLQAVKVVYYS